MAKYTVQYATNTLIPDEKRGGLKQLNFFTDAEGKNKEDVEWQIGQKIYMESFIKDKGGYMRRTNTIVSYIVKENKTEFKEIKYKGDK